MQDLEKHDMIGGIMLRSGTDIMKKNDWILAGGVLVIACLMGILIYWSQSKGHYVVVTVNGEEYGHYDLDEDQTVDINETNRLEIKDGKASMIYADCPDKLCVHMVPISRSHEMIVCMPNKVTVEAFEK